jgi:metallophosphoesterase (TIGR00282 family)
MLKILFIGDISGKIGRKTVAKIVPKLKKSEKIDLVIANAENSAHGSGVTESTIKELFDAGVDWLTTGDHAFKANKQYDIFNDYNILRPANFPAQVPGRGYALFEHKGKNILLVNLIGRVFMGMDYDDPFFKIDEILANISLPKEKLSAIIIDMHGECTSEKVALRHYLDGRVSAIFGTHTHIMTADQQITPKGTAYITDVGMTGFADGVLGVEKDGIIKTFLTQIKQQHVIPEKGAAIMGAVMVTINPLNARAKHIQSVIRQIEIK